MTTGQKLVLGGGVLLVGALIFIAFRSRTSGGSAGASALSGHGENFQIRALRVRKFHEPLELDNSNREPEYNLEVEAPARRRRR